MAENHWNKSVETDHAERAAARQIDRVNDWLHLGGAVPPEEQHRLRDAGISCVVDLREEVSADAGSLHALGIEMHHVPVPNHAAPTMAQLEQVVRLANAGDTGSSLYVHCQGGFGRAATMTIGLLVNCGYSLSDAVGEVERVRPEIRLNEDQFAWLRAVEVASRR